MWQTYTDKSMHIFGSDLNPYFVQTFGVELLHPQKNQTKLLAQKWCSSGLHGQMIWKFLSHKFQVLTVVNVWRVMRSNAVKYSKMVICFSVKFYTKWKMGFSDHRTLSHGRIQCPGFNDHTIQVKKIKTQSNLFK